MSTARFLLFLLSLVSISVDLHAQRVVVPDQVNFIRQGVRRFVFDETLAIPLSVLNPREVVGIASMYPVKNYGRSSAEIRITDGRMSIGSGLQVESSVWFGGFNPFAAYTIDGLVCQGQGMVGFEFADAGKAQRFIIGVEFSGGEVRDVRQVLIKDNKVVVQESIAVKGLANIKAGGRLILQMLGGGLTLFMQDGGLPVPIAQSDFNKHIDLRKKIFLHSFHSSLYVRLNTGNVSVTKVTSVLGSGMGLADIRAITYENGDPFLDQGRLWYTMTMRGRALPHHIQGVFSLNPTVFDLKFEGIIVFDQNDGLLRNEVASHIFFDRRDGTWRGLTTGFSSFADPNERKQLFAVSSQRDPRFGFSVMNAVPTGIVGDYEDPHVLYDSAAARWRMLTCVNENKKGYRVVLLESDTWNKGYRRIALADEHDATGTSIQKIGDARYCFSGSSERQVFIYTYPDLREAGQLKMDLPPWDENAGTRIWPNVVQLPAGYPFKYVALMMDRYKYPGIEGNHWSYGAVYLYHGYEE